MAAPSIVQAAKATTRGGEVVSASFGSTPTVGNLVVVFCSSDADLTSGSNTCSDNQGNTYTRQVSTYGSGSTIPTGAAIWTTVIATASGTFTVTFDTNLANNRTAIGIAEISGQHASSWLNQVGSGLDQSSGQSSPAVADLPDTTAADCLVMGCAAMDNASGATDTNVMAASSGWTELSGASYPSVAGVNWPIEVVYKTAASAGAHDPSIDFTTGDAAAWWAACGIAIAPVASGSNALAGGATAGATASATLSVQRNLAANAVAGALASGGLSVSRPLTGAAIGAALGSGTLTAFAQVWRIPTNTPNGTAVHVIVMSGLLPSYAVLAQGNAVVAGGYVDVPGSGVAGTKAFAFVHNYNDNTATVSIRGGPAIATLTSI